MTDIIPETDAEVRYRTASTITVLVVEDEPFVRLNATMMLQSAGYVVCEANSGASGMEQLRRCPEVRVLFTDINMPGDFDGLELARQISVLRPDIHLILTSGLMRPGVHELSGGEFIAKPYDDDRVADMIRIGAARAH